jgi:hypothetical protein
VGRDVWNDLRKTATQTVVIADSNGRNWKAIPSSWTTLARPGGRLEDATQLLNSTSIPEHVKHVLLAVGVNNATDDLSAITTRLTALHAAARKHGSRVLFVEVPTHPNAKTIQTRAVDHINKTARDLFTDQFYVGMSADFIVTANSGNSRDTVHYDVSTAGQIIARVEQVISNLN